MTDRTRELDVIRLEGLTVNCIVGVYPHERLRPQPLRVDMALTLDTRPAASGGGLKKSVDYARLCGEIRFLLESCRFYLLETAADALCRYILAPATADAPHAFIEHVSLKLEKPEAIEGVRPSLEVRRRASEMSFKHEQKPFGTVDVIHETKECGIYRLRVAPGRSIPTHVHRTMEERELILGDGLILQGVPIEPGASFAWPKELPHRYDNPSATEQTILCVDRPRFIPDDEIEVDAPQAGLTLPEPVYYYPESARRDYGRADG